MLNTNKPTKKYHIFGNSFWVACIIKKMKILTTIGLVLICLRLIAQTGQPVNYSELDSVHKAKIDSLIFDRIPYSCEKAKQDINNKNIQIIDLTPGGSPEYSSDEMKSVEQRFGFHFVFDFLEYPRQYLEQAETKYNDIVYQYLDSINRIDTKKEIWSELARIYYERQVFSNKTDEELGKQIRRKLRGECKEIKAEVLHADKLYRDRKFIDALKEYERIGLQKTTTRTGCYLENSKYHSLMNLQRYAEADSLKKMNKEISPIIK